jgi:hypothetical protein
MGLNFHFNIRDIKLYMKHLKTCMNVLNPADSLHRSSNKRLH